MLDIFSRDGAANQRLSAGAVQRRAVAKPGFPMRVGVAMETKSFRGYSRLPVTFGG